MWRRLLNCSKILNGDGVGRANVVVVQEYLHKGFSVLLMTLIMMIMTMRYLVEQVRTLVITVDDDATADVGL